LQAATNWPQAREELHKIHALVHAELPLIPLWQLADHYAHRAAVTGIAAKPISLYQGIDQWRITPQAAVP
jgi:hypothetical protein